jgi:hypothetical protein
MGEQGWGESQLQLGPTLMQLQGSGAQVPLPKVPGLLPH